MNSLYEVKNKMEQEQKEIQDKVFGKLPGKILPESIVLENIYDLSFDFKSKDSLHRFRVNDRRIVTKLCQLYGISHKNTVRDLRLSGKLMSDIVTELENTLRDTIKQNNRIVVLLTDEHIRVKSIVSEQHKQLPLSKAYEIVNSIANKKGAKLVTSRETGQSYIVEYEVDTNRDMSVRVRAYLGRNDALGRAGIRFEGGGNIFVCSNMIVPHIDKDITLKGNELLNVKIVHTVNVEERLKNQLIKSFDYAKKNSQLLGRKLTQSKSIKMSRDLQKHCIELIRIKHNLPNKWNYYVKRRLEEETETLYGLSQALTYVGTHQCNIDTEIQRKLQRIGGQVVLLGKDFVKLIEKSIKARGLIVPEIQVQNSF